MALDSLATDTDLEAALGRALTTEEAARSTDLLARASARVRSAAGGQQFVAVTGDVVRLRVMDDHTARSGSSGAGIVRLPQRPVTAVNSVKRPDGTDLTFAWPGLSIVQVYLQSVDDFTDVPWPRRELDIVDVDYDHGYDELPEDPVAITVNVVLRALARAPLAGDTIAMTVQGYSEQRSLASAAAVLGLLSDEKDMLKPYRRQTGTLRLS